GGVPGADRRAARRPHRARVRALPAARRTARRGRPASRDLLDDVGRRDAPPRPLGRRPDPPRARQAGAGRPGLALHPHPLRDWISVQPRTRRLASPDAKRRRRRLTYFSSPAWPWAKLKAQRKLSGWPTGLPPAKPPWSALS